MHAAHVSTQAAHETTPFTHFGAKYRCSSELRRRILVSRDGNKVSATIQRLRAYMIVGLVCERQALKSVSNLRLSHLGRKNCTPPPAAAGWFPPYSGSRWWWAASPEVCTHLGACTGSSGRPPCGTQRLCSRACPCIRPTPVHTLQPHNRRMCANATYGRDLAFCDSTPHPSDAIQRQLTRQQR